MNTQNLEPLPHTPQHLRALTEVPEPYREAA